VSDEELREDADQIEAAERASGIDPDKTSSINKIVATALSQPLLSVFLR
jgi:hypothetical protein